MTKNHPLYNTYGLAVKMLVVNAYENREPIGKVEKKKTIFESMLLKLKYYAPAE
jgi:hypothetical protein